MTIEPEDLDMEERKQRVFRLAEEITDYAAQLEAKARELMQEVEHGE